MKYSGVEWIGDIPIHWKLVSVKHLFIIGRGRVIAKTELDDNGDYPVYSSQTKNNGVLGFIDTYDYDVSQLTWTTDGANAGTVFLREGKYNCTNVCGTLLPKISNMSMKYMKYALEYIAIFHKRADTNGFKIMNNEMAVIKILLPLEKEQQKIAAFLDEKVAHIDNIIEDTKKSIENLKFYKQSLIAETVTKGINPNVEMKDSGIEWIGEIPAHWNIMKLSYLSRKIGDGIHSTPNYDDSGNYYFINGNNFYNKSIIYRKNTQRVNDSEFDKFKIDFDRNTIFISLNGTIGNLAYYNEEKIILGKSAGYIKIKKDIDRGFIYYYLLSAASKTAFDLSFAGTTINNLSLYTLRNLKVTIPSKEEQVEVSMFLDKKTQHIDLLINQKEKIINELESYKKSLIYEYVTGKKEVK